MRCVPPSGSAPADIAVAKARLALNDKSDKAGALLDAVPAEARNDPNYVFGRIQWLRRQDKIAEAGQLMLSMPRDPYLLHDVDEWWVERRLLARKLLDIGDAQTAYRGRARRGPAREGEQRGRARIHRRLDRAALPQRSARPRLPTSPASRRERTHPTSLARAHYWQGRALEALGRNSEARTQYQAAAALLRAPTTARSRAPSSGITELDRAATAQVRAPPNAPRCATSTSCARSSSSTRPTSAISW